MTKPKPPKRSNRELLPEFDIPESRRDVSKITNVRWLLRNIRVKNSNHPRLDDMVEALKKQFKALRKKG